MTITQTTSFRLYDWNSHCRIKFNCPQCHILIARDMDMEEDFSCPFEVVCINCLHVISCQLKLVMDWEEVSNEQATYTIKEAKK